MKTKCSWDVKLKVVSSNKKTADEIEIIIMNQLRNYFKEGRVEAI